MASVHLCPDEQVLVARLSTATVHNDDAHLACEVLQMSVDIAAAFDKTLGAEGCQASIVLGVQRTTTIAE
jgi:hypothetical protein